MRTTATRKRHLGKVWLMAPVLGLSLLAGPAGAVERVAAEPGATQEAKTPTLTGNWAVRVTFTNPNIPAEAGLFSFSSAGTTTGTTTRAQNLTLGGWRNTSTGFELSFRHFTYNDADEWTGEVRVTQTGTMTSHNTWSSTGTGTAYDTTGKEVARVESAITGTRY